MNNKLFELSDSLKALRDRKKALELEVKTVNGEISTVEMQLIDLMVENEVPSFKRGDSGFSLVIQNYPQAEASRKDELYEAFKEHGFSHLFTINHQTLTSTLKELMEQNEGSVPNWLEGLIKNYEKTSIRIYKS